MSVLAVLQSAGGEFHPMSAEALGAGRILAEALSVPLRVLVVGGPAEKAAAMGVEEAVSIEHPALDDYTADGYSAAFAQALGELQPQYVVFPHTYQVRDFAPKLATTLGRPFLSDCTALRVEDGEAIFTRQVFQGKLNADCAFVCSAPRLFSVQSGAFSADKSAAETAAPVRRLEVQLDAAAIRVQPSAPYKEAAGEADLSSAERIVSVGRGIKDPENIALAKKLADALGAELAASRPICDSGWLPLDRQVGSSGQTVSPKLYLALGISGAIQHLVGMKGSQVIAAINIDPSAPIFDVADFGVAGDLFEVVPELLKQLEQ